MRPLRLVMRAFGPYAGEQVIDFRALEARSFFLINGPTGSGKTSILDAMCFALYGETSGGERPIRHVRSDHAEPDVPTEVVLDFAIGDEEFRVFRRPEQHRPKRRGSGTTREPARATLWRTTVALDGKGQGAVVAQGWNRVNEEVERLLGFRSDQFRQVAVLPQGQFRRFLSAGSSERQQILEVLFQTGLYRQIEEALKEEADRAKAETEGLLEKKKGILQQLGAETLPQLEEMLKDAARERGALEDTIKDLRRQEASAQMELEQAREVIRKLHEYDRAQADLRTLEARKDEFQEKQQRLSRAERAALLRDVEREFRERDKELDQARQQLQRAEEDLSRAQQQKAKADEQWEREMARQQERESARREADRLEALRAQVQGLELSRSRVRLLEGRVRELGRLSDGKRARLEGCVRALQEAQREKEQAAVLASRLDARHLQHEQLLRSYQTRLRLDSLCRDHTKARKDLADLQGRLNKANEERSSAQRELDLLDDRWRKGQAAVLARQLRAGMPCPVCGATEHPMPAKEEVEVPTESDLERARKRVREMEYRVQQLQEGASSAREAVAGLEAQIRTLEAELGAHVHEDASSLKGQVSHSKALLEEAKKARERLYELEERIKRLEEERNQAEKDTERATAELQQAHTELAAARGALELSERSIPEELRSKESLEEAIAMALRHHKELEDALQGALERRNNAREALARAQATLNNAAETEARASGLAAKAREGFLRRLKEAGFAGVEDYQASRMEEEPMKRLRDEIQEFTGSLQEAQQRLARAQKEAEGLRKPDLEPLERRFEQVKGSLEEALRRSGEVDQRLEQLRSAAREVEKVEREISEREAHYGVVGRLAEVASGRNPYNITFERFVLSALLDEVLAAASARLRLMTNGRFHLERLEGVQDRRRAGGLELVVYDAYTGTNRPVNTLSGGEGFLASLALALGLSDVVQSYAGGIRLDTMFVDEGFGSLDPEALDLALRALVDLQEEGRLVGIISHVPELRERVDVRLEVVPGRRGSVARFVM